jgi:hypothetical protein
VNEKLVNRLQGHLILLLVSFKTHHWLFVFLDCLFSAFGLFVLVSLGLCLALDLIYVLFLEALHRSAPDHIWLSCLLLEDVDRVVRNLWHHTFLFERRSLVLIVYQAPINRILSIIIILAAKINLLVF